jgi:hypothetical protein
LKRESTRIFEFAKLLAAWSNILEEHLGWEVCAHDGHIGLENDLQLEHSVGWVIQGLVRHMLPARLPTACLNYQEQQKSNARN